MKPNGSAQASSQRPVLPDRLLPADGRSIVLAPTRSSALTTVFLAAIIGGGAYAARQSFVGDGSGIATALLAVSIICVAMCGLTLASLPMSVNRLVLSPEGFVVRRWLVDRAVPWTLVRGFHVGAPTGFSPTALWGSAVVFRLKGDAPWQRKDRKRSSAAAPDFAVYNHAGLKAEMMLELLESWRDYFAPEDLEKRH